MSSPTIEVLVMVAQERVRQDVKYGEVNATMPSGSGPGCRWLLPYTNASAAQIESDLRADYEDFEEDTGGVTRVHLLREEIAEAFEREEGDPRLLEEVIQVAALAVAWAERLIAIGTVEPADHLWVEGEVAQA